MKCVNVIIIGAGSRGQTYAEYAALAPDEMRIVGVAEPREYHRNFLRTKHQIPSENCVLSWEQLASRPKFADAVIIATQDELHVDPVLAFAERGYAILLEKPMATTIAGCRKIYDAIHRYHNLFAVCHVLRYTAYTQAIKNIIEAGTIGDVVAAQHMEPVGYWHQAHSFVRGNWRNTAESSPMLLQKSCHDIDWLRYIVGQPFKAVSSFGELTHFCAKNRPSGASERCLDCPEHIERECPYSALKIYFGFLNEGRLDWPLDVVVPTPTAQSLESALRTGPYGRCVYACDNNVMDHQSVNIAFENGAHATFLASAFTPKGRRTSVIAGTRGMLSGNFETLEHYDFLTQRKTKIDIPPSSQVMDGHGGGDGSLIKNFIHAVRENNPALLKSGLEESYESYIAVFAAEEARIKNKVVTLNKEFYEH